MKKNQLQNVSDLSDGVTPLDTSDFEDGAVPAELLALDWTIDEEKTQAHGPLTINGQEVKVLFYKNGAVRFGVDKPSKEYKTLWTDTSCKGFINAGGYFMDNPVNEKYMVFERGVHLKFALDDDFDYEYKQDAGYVNMKRMRNMGVAQLLADRGIKPESGEWGKSYHVLHIVDEELVYGHELKGRTREALREYATQLVHKSLIEKAKKAGQPWENIPAPVLSAEDMVPWIRANDKTYEQIALHKGFDYWFDILAGKRTVTVFLYGGKPKAGFEHQIDFFNSRVDRLWGTREEREAARAEGVAFAKGLRRTQDLARRMGKSPKLAAYVDTVVSGGVVVLVADRNGKLAESKVAAEDLVKANMYTVDKDTKDRVGVDPVFRTPQEARVGVTRILNDGKLIVVRAFAAS